MLGLLKGLPAGQRRQRGRLGRVLLPLIDRSRARGQAVVVRADAAFALPALYEALEGPQGT